MFRPGDQIGSFTLLQKIGRGAFGEVWLAEEKTAISTHRVALKLPNDHVIDLDAIRQEASVWENVKGHPNILPIIKADIIDDQIYIASEYAPDGSLSKWLKINGGKAPNYESAVNLTKGILSGLGHLHSKGVIHRDLKPENILLQSETPRIADFGIARLIKSTTSSTQVTGTPAYMAPECYYSVRSVQTDIWAAGVIFYLLLSGRLPFPQPDQISIMNAVLNSEPPINADIPTPFRGIIRKALQKDPGLRYGSAAEMLGDLNMIVAAAVEDGELTIDLTPLHYSVRDQETVVSLKGPAKTNTSAPLNFFKIGTIAAGVLLVLGLGTYWATTRTGKTGDPQVTNSNTAGGSTAGMAPVQQLDQSSQGGDGTLVRETGTIPDSNSLAAPVTIPGGDGYSPWGTEATRPPGAPIPVNPPGQTVTVMPGDSQFMPQGDGTGTVILVPVPVDPNATPTPGKTARPTPTPGNPQTAPGPEAPKTTTTPEAKPRTTTTPQPRKTPVPDKKVTSGKPRDS